MAASDTLAIARLLAEVRGLTEVDARLAVRSGSGSVARRIPRAQAESLQRCLDEAGYPSVLISENELYTLPRSRKVSRLRITDEGLELQIGYRMLPVIPWTELVTLNAYVYSQEIDQSTRDGRINRGVSVAGITELCEHARNLQWKLSSHIDKFPNRRLTLTIDLIALGPPRLFRIENGSLTYDCLEDISPHSLQNFVRLLARLKSHFSGAELPQRSELMSRPLTPLEFYLIEKEEERNNGNHWLLQRQALTELWAEHTRHEDPAFSAAGQPLAETCRDTAVDSGEEPVGPTQAREPGPDLAAGD